MELCCSRLKFLYFIAEKLIELPMLLSILGWCGVNSKAQK